MIDAYNEGYRARFNRKSIFDNPYQPKTEKFSAWVEGWKDANSLLTVAYGY